jgi:transcription initiation factor IIE alpha subunit
MKLYKALKIRKSLIGDINKLKEEIKSHNSFLVGSKNSERYNVNEAYNQLFNKVNNLVALKYVINEANREIQSKIYLLSEYKALIAFLNEISVKEGVQAIGYAEQLREYAVHLNEYEIKKMIEKYQTKIDALQDEIDIFNHTTDIPWGNEENE